MSFRAWIALTALIIVQAAIWGGVLLYWVIQ